MIRLKHSPITMVLAFILASLAGNGPVMGKVVTDQLDRTVTLPDHPSRIIAMAPSITEIVHAVGRSHLLVGVTQFSDFPPEVRKLPKIGSYVHLNLERIVALAPDLCIAVKDGNPISAVRRLESLGVPVYAVDPRDLDSVMDTVLRIGRLLDAGDRAAAVVRDMKNRIDRIEAAGMKSRHRPGVFFQIGISPIVTVGTNTVIHKLITKAGGTNLTRGPVPYPRYSREQVLALSPDVMVISSMARGGVFENIKAQWEKWPQLPAVKNGRIFLVDSNLFDRPTPRLADGLELLFRLIHPEAHMNREK